MKLPLNEKLLDVLLAMERKRKLCLVEASLGLVDNWAEPLKEYFDALPKELVEDLGLKRNLACYRRIEIFEVPQEWMSVEVDKLGQFWFGYPG